MSVSREEVERIASLAKLNLSEEEKERMTGQLNVILEYMQKLNQLDTSDIRPLSHPLELTNIFREDEAGPSLPADEAVRNAPARSGNYFKVPKVINR